MTPLTSGIGRQVAVGAGWMIGARLTDRVVGLVSIVVLARLLAPEDFGVVALATSVIAILAMISELSVELVLIQNQAADRSHYDTAWTLNVIKGFVLAGILVALASPAAGWLAEPRVTPILYALAVVVGIGGFENIGMVDFRKHFQFHREYVFLMSGRAAGTLVTVVAALLSPGPWALVAGTAARQVVALALSYVMQSYRPRLSLRAFGDVFRFSKWVMLENLLSGVRHRAHNVIVGRVAGAQVLGFYSMAYELAMMASSEIEQPIRRAVFPGYAKVASDRGLLRRAFLDVLGMIALLAAPLAVGVGAIANVIVPLLLGAKWLETIPLIQILSVFGLIVVLGGGARLVYLALNKPYVATLLSAADATLLLPLSVVGALWAGAIGVAWAMVSTVSVTWLLTMMIVMRVLDIRARAIVGRLWRVVLALLAMVLSVGQVQTYWNGAESLVGMATQLLACVVVAATVYLGAVLAFWQVSGRPEGAESHLLHGIQVALKRFTEPAPSAATLER